MTLDYAIEAFDAFPTYATAKQLQHVVKEYFDDGMITDNECAVIIEKIKRWAVTQ